LSARRWGALLIVILAATALRLYRLDGPSLRGDEAFSIMYARNTPQEMLRSFTSSTEPHPPLSFFLLHYWGQVAGQSEFALRFTSVWFGVLCVVLIYALGQRLWDERVGLAAAGLLAINPFYIWHAQEARMYAILAALTMASTLLYVALLARRGWGWWAGYGALTALAVYTHYYAALIAIAQGLYAALYVLLPSRTNERRQRVGALLRWGAGLGVAGALYLPWLLPSLSILGAYQGSARSQLPFFEPIYRCLLVFGQGQTLPRQASVWFVPLWGGLLAGGVLVAWRRTRASAAWASLYLGVPWAVIFVDSLRRPAFDERYFMVSTPPYYLFVALALVALVDGRRAARAWRVLGGLAGTAILAVCGVSLYNHYYNPAYARAPDWRALNAYIIEHARPGDVVVLNYPDPAASYYYDLPVPWYTLPASYPVDAEATAARLDELAHTYDRVWLTPQRWDTWDSEGLVERWLDAHTERVLGTQVDQFRVVRYHTPQQYQRELTPADARLGEDIDLLGYVVRDETGQAVDQVEVRPGEEVRLTLYWQAVARLDSDYVVFVHLLDETGWLRGQQDNQPRAGTYPTRAWTPGEWVVDTYHIPVAADAPPGAYAIEVGMYRPGDGTRLEVSGADADPENRRVLLWDRVRVQ
jgi:mannosyltransferase